MTIRIAPGTRRSRRRIEPLIGAIVCTALSATGFYVAFGADNLHCGIPLIPDAWNQTAGRFAFGAGALITGALAVYAFRELFRWSKADTTEERPD
jgi:hypothetical protein